MKPRFNAFSSSVWALALATFTMVSHARAADQSWLDTNANNDWNTSTGLNWDAGVAWTQGNNAIFGGTGETVTLTEGISTGGLTFNSTGYTIAGNTLTLTSGAVINTGANTASINSILAGAGFTKSGSGTLILGSANTGYTGAVSINAGTLQLNAKNALLSANAVTLGANGGAANPILSLAIATSSGDTSIGALTVPANVTDATIAMPQNSVTVSHTIGGASLGSALNCNQSNATSPRWTQITWSAPITGTGGGSGNDTLVFNNTSSMQNYFTMAANQVNAFSGNVHLKAGLIAVQSGTPGGNLVIPDASMLWLEAGEWRWNSGSMTETIDGLRGAGLMGNPQNVLLSIDANNSANDPNRSFSGTMGNLRGVLTMGGGGAQEFSGGNVTFNNGVNLNNGILKLTKTTGWGSNIAFGSSNNPNLQLNAPLAADAWNFSKLISGANAGASVEKIGDGTVTFPVSQTYSGTTTVSAGALKLQSTDYPTAMPSIPGMKVWLDAADPDGNNVADSADGSSVSVWKNKGTLGATADFTASATGTNNPTYKASVAAFNNKPTINFVATDKMLANTVNFTNTVSVVYVGRIGATKQRLVSGGATNWILGYHGGNMGANYWNGGALGSTADTNPHIWINGATSGANAKGYRFDAAGETTLGDGTGGVGPVTGLTLGGVWSTTTERSDGDIAELFVFDHQLTTTERVQLEGYLYNKYYGSQYPSTIAGLNTSSPVSVANGASFGGYGSAGATTVAAGGTVLAGNSGTGSLTLGSLTFSGPGTVSGTPSPTAAPLVVSGALTTGGANSVSVAVPGTLAVGTHHAIQYGSLSGSIGDFKFPAPSRTMTLANNTPYIDVLVSATSAYPVWTGSGSGEWSYGTGLNNWKLSTDSSATSFMSNDAVLFDDTVGSGNTALTVGVDSISAGVITFNNGGKNYTLTQANGKDITSGSLVKTGGGSLTISGSFTYAGGSTLNGGTVSIDSVGGLGTGGRSFNGGTLEYTGATGTIAGTTTVNSGGATIRVTQADAVLTQSGGLVPGGSGTITKQGDGGFVLPLGAGTYVNSVTVNGGTLNLNYGGNAAVLSGGITGSAGVLSLSGTGASATTGLTLQGASTFSGETWITGRRIFLDCASGNALSGSTIRFTQGNWPYHNLTLNRNEQIADSSVLSWESTNATLYELRLNGKIETVAGLDCVNQLAIIENAGYDGGNDADNTIAAGTLIVNTANVSDNHAFNGAVRDKNGGTNGSLNFVKQGPGSQTLERDFSYTGTTTVNGGTLVLKDPTNTFASSSVSLASGSTLELYKSSGSWTVAPPIGGAGGLTKSGFGTVILSGTNAYTGTTTVAQGTLIVTGSIASPLIDVQFDGTLGGTVASGKTVQGNGTLSSVTFAGGSTLEPGTPSSIDTLVGSGTITFAAGSTCVMQVNRTGGIITNDQLTNMNSVVYGGTLTVAATGQSFVNGDQIYLFPGAASYGGSFASVNLPALSPGLSWDLSGLTTTGSIKVVNFTATPIFNPPAGGYVGSQSVSISSDSGSTIYYTVDGSNPTTSSPSGLSPVSGLPVPTNSSVTIKAFARKAGQADSPIATAVYNTLDVPVWISDLDGSWQDTFNWQSDVVAQGAGVIADFSTLATTALNTVHLDGPRTLGGLKFGDQNDANGWTLDSGTGGSLILNNGANPPVVTVLNQTTTISAPTSSGNGLLKKGAGTLRLDDTNAITGAFTISQGTLTANKPAALGASANTVTLGDTGTADGNPGLKLDTGVNSTVTLGSITSTSNGASQTITLNAGSGLPANQAALVTTLNLNGSVPVTLKATNTGGHSTAQDVNWRITGSGIPSGSTALILDGTGGSGVALRTSQQGDTSAASNFTGDVLIKGVVITQGRTYLGSGNIAANQNLNFLNNNVTVDAGAEWRIIWGGETSGALNGPGNIVLNCQSALNNIGLTIGNNNAGGTHTGVISGGWGLSKAGSGTQTLGGANTYSGATTVNAGTLALANATGSATGSGAVTVKSGATLTGAGSASGATTVESGATLLPGNNGAGILTLGSATIAGAVELKLNDATCGRLTVTGTLTINPGATINLGSIAPPTAVSYTLISYGTLGGTLPTITGIPSGYALDTATAGQVKLVQSGGYAAWASSFPGLADTSPGGDPDKDGVSNLLEYVLGGDPRVSSRGILPTQAISGSNLVISYKRSDASETDTTQTGQWSANLGAWSNVAPVLVNENGNAPDDMTITIPLSNAVNGKLFGRLKVTQP